MYLVPNLIKIAFVIKYPIMTFAEDLVNDGGKKTLVVCRGVFPVFVVTALFFLKHYSGACRVSIRSLRTSWPQLLLFAVSQHPWLSGVCFRHAAAGTCVRREVQGTEDSGINLDSCSRGACAQAQVSFLLTHSVFSFNTKATAQEIDERSRPKDQ